MTKELIQGYTGSSTVVAITQDGKTTIRVPSVDWNGRPYVREILIEGRVLDLGREAA